MKPNFAPIIVSFVTMVIGFILGRAELTGKRLQKAAEKEENKTNDKVTISDSYNVHSARNITDNVEKQLAEVVKYFEKHTHKHLTANIAYNSSEEKRITVIVMYKREVICNKDYWYYHCKKNGVFNDLIERIPPKLRVKEGIRNDDENND